MSPRVGLDRETVVREAAALADVEGLEALTLARLAGKLGIRPPSLYNHVAGLEDLRRELALLGLRDLTERLGRAAVGRAGEEAVEALAEAYRAYARQRPGLYAASLRAPDPQDSDWQAAGERVVGIVLAAFAGFGLRNDEALHAVRGLRSALHGFVGLEATGGFGLPLDRDESFRRLIRAYLSGLRVQADAELVYPDASGNADAGPNPRAHTGKPA